MPMSTDIQNKVVEIASNPVVNKKAKLAVRKRFYELKNEEITLEEVQDDFDTKIAEFNMQLDAIINKLNATKANVITVDKPTQVYEDDEEEEIILPVKEKPKVAGQKVRMQEEVDVNPDEDTDFEVPFEADES